MTVLQNFHWTFDIQHKTNDPQMSNKVAMVVGGGSGMGAAAARKLVQDGFQVAVLSSSGEGEALGRELGGIGLTGSNQSSEDLQKLVDQTMARWGRMTCWSTAQATVPRARFWS